MLHLLLLVLLQDDNPPPLKVPEEPKNQTEKISDPNLLGKTDTQSGEARRNENNFITAIDNNAQKEASARLGTTATAIDDFVAQAKYFGAEFGAAPAPYIHLAGPRNSRAIHGNLTWTHSNSVFAARSFFQVGGVKPARENVFGARLGSPLWKGAYLTFDGGMDTRRGFVNGNILIPKASERSCLSPDQRVCAVIDRFFGAWPNQTPNRPDIEERALNTNSAQAIDTFTTSARLDQSAGPRHRFALRHAWNNQQVDAFQLVAGQNPDTTTKSHDARLTWTFARNAKSVLDATAAFTRNRTLLVPEPNAVGPQVQVGTAFDKLGPGSSIPVDRIQNRFRYAIRYQQIVGNHSLSFTADLVRLQFNGEEASSNRGNIYFRNDFGRDAITNFRLGLVSRYSFGLGELNRGFRRWEPSWSVSDVWRVNASLSVSAGLRHQPQSGISEVNGLTTIPFQCDCNNFAPFLGLAWKAPKRLGIFRAAYATQYGEIFPATLQQLRWNPPAFLKIENQTPPLSNLLQGVALDPNGRAIVFHYPENLKTPYSHQYNFSWDLPLPQSVGKVTASYIGSRTWKLLYMQYLNRAIPVAGIPQTTATINNRRPDSRYFDYREISNSSRAYFDAAKLNYSFNTRFGLTGDASYWFSKAIDTGANFQNIAAGDDAMQGQAQFASDIAADLRGVSDFHQKHAFLSRLGYQPSWRQPALRNWRLSTVFLAKSGLPFTVISGSDSPGFGNVDGIPGDRVNLLDASILGATIASPDVASSLIPRSAFAFIGPTALRGNLGTNTFRRAGFRNLNASLNRRFSLSQDRAIAFRAESIDALNTPQFAEPIADLSNPAFGKITNTLNDGRGFRFSLSLEF